MIVGLSSFRTLLNLSAKVLFLGSDRQAKTEVYYITYLPDPFPLTSSIQSEWHTKTSFKNWQEEWLKPGTITDDHELLYIPIGSLKYTKE